MPTSCIMLLQQELGSLWICWVRSAQEFHVSYTYIRCHPCDEHKMNIQFREGNFPNTLAVILLRFAFPKESLFLIKASRPKNFIVLSMWCGNHQNISRNYCNLFWKTKKLAAAFHGSGVEFAVHTERACREERIWATRTSIARNIAFDSLSSARWMPYVHFRIVTLTRPGLWLFQQQFERMVRFKNR